MLGLTFNYLSHVSAWQATDTDAMKSAESKAKQVQSTASGYESDNQSIQSEFESIQTTGADLVSNVEGRVLWLEMLKGLQSAMPRDPRPAEERKQTREDISDRNELHFLAMDSKRFDDLEGEWFATVEPAYMKARGLGGGDDDFEAEEVDFESGGEDGGFEDGPAVGSLEGPGWVIQLTGYHYHNLDPKNDTSRFVKNTIIKSLEDGTVMLPDGEGDALIEVPLTDLGLSHPWIVKDSKIVDDIVDPNAALDGRSARSGYGGESEGGYGGRRARPAAESDSDDESAPIELRRYNFVIQFAWRPTTKSERQEIAEQRRLQAEQEKADAEALEEDSAEVL